VLPDIIARVINILSLREQEETRRASLAWVGLRSGPFPFPIRRAQKILCGSPEEGVFSRALHPTKLGPNDARVKRIGFVFRPKPRWSCEARLTHLGLVIGGDKIYHEFCMSPYNS
jgi:hypothetical protein